jgi:hypothetical protein
VTARKKKTHPCNARVNTLLKERGTRLVVGLLTPDVAALWTEVITPGRGRRPAIMVASYCPFCGEKYDDAALHPAVLGRKTKKV